MKKVLCGIYQYPDYSTKNLAKALALNESTFFTFKARLKERELTEMRFIPDFFSLINAKVILSSGKYRYQLPNEIRKSIIGFVNYPAIPFLVISDETSWLALSLLPPQKTTQSENLSFISKEYLEKMIFELNYIIFETENTRVWRFLNSGPLLCKTFEIELPPRTFSISKPWDHTQLNNNEKVILYSLIEKPEISDYKRSKFLRISHPTISKIRNELIKNGILKKVLFTNFSKLGFSLLSWFIVKIGETEIDKKSLFPLATYSNIILSIQSKTHIFLFSVHQNMKSLMEDQQLINNFISANSISYEDIIFNYYSLESQDFNLNFNVLTPTQIFFELSIHNIETQTTEDPESELVQLLKSYLSDSDIKSVINKVNNSIKAQQPLYTMYRSNSNHLISMILELLTEPEYLSVLEEYKRNNLQIELIKKINHLRSKLELKEHTNTFEPKKSILIVEDQKTVATLLNDMLSSANYNVLGVVDNGLDAYNLYRNLTEIQNKPDLILMDVFLKGLNGIEATKMIKDFDPEAKIVILTSSPSNKIKNEISSYGIDDYLIKPVTKTHLIDRLNFVTLKNKRQ